jgi:hypothetical protein
LCVVCVRSCVVVEGWEDWKTPQSPRVITVFTVYSVGLLTHAPYWKMAAECLKPTHNCVLALVIYGVLNFTVLFVPCVSMKSLSTVWSNTMHILNTVQLYS